MSRHWKGILIALVVVAFLAAILLPATQRAREHDEAAYRNPFPLPSEAESSSSRVVLLPSYFSTTDEFVSVIDENVLMQTPDWKSSDDNPPVSARKAMELANEMKDSLGLADNEDKEWSVVSVKLEPYITYPGKWYWEVWYQASLKKVDSTGSPETLIVLVLMDGSVVRPKPKVTVK